MKATIKQTELGRALKVCVNAIEPKDPIRSNIEFDAEGDSVKIQATNSTYSLSINCSAEVEEEGVSIVDGKMAYNVVSKATGDCLLTSDEKSMTIKTSGRTKLPNISRDLPMIDSFSGKSFSCDAVSFRNAIGKVYYAISEDQSRIILTGAHIVTDGSTMEITSLDGFRLAQTSILCEGDSVDIVVPSKVLGAVCDVITSGKLEFTANGIHLSVVGEGFRINSIMLSGAYIDTARIIPKDFTTNALVQTADIRNLADSATVASGSSNLVKLEIGNDRIVVKSNSENADFNGDITGMIDGDELTIAFNLKYLVQALNHIDTEQCELHFNSSVSPAIISTHTTDTVKDINLILPVRVFG